MSEIKQITQPMHYERRRYPPRPRQQFPPDARQWLRDHANGLDVGKSGDGNDFCDRGVSTMSNA